MNVVKLEKSRCPGPCRSPAVFRLLVHLQGTSHPDVNPGNGYTASSSTASVTHLFGEGGDQKKHLANTEERSSREPEEQKDDTLIYTRTKHTQTHSEESESRFHLKEQSLSRRAIRHLLIFFIILGVIVIFMIACQYVFLEAKRSWDLNKCMNGLAKLCFVGTRNPPI